MVSKNVIVVIVLLNIDISLIEIEVTIGNVNISDNIDSFISVGISAGQDIDLSGSHVVAANSGLGLVAGNDIVSTADFQSNEGVTANVGGDLTLADIFT